MKSSIAASLVLASAALAAPTYSSMSGSAPAMSMASGTASSSAAMPSGTAKADIDIEILNYALTLEHLEAAFYAGGLNKYSAADFLADGFASDVRQRTTEVALEEKNHVDFLTFAVSAAGGTPVAACNYSFPDTSPSTFLAVAQILEGVGVSAYIGAAGLITNPAYLAAAAAILPVEARHNAFLRSSVGLDPFPTTYDRGLDFDQVYTMASGFITGCPASNPALAGVKAFPTLTIGKTGTLVAEQEIYLTFPGWDKAQGAFAIFLSGLGQTAVPYNSTTGYVAIPKGLAGSIYVIIASSNATISDEITLAGPVAFEVPTAPYNAMYN